MSEGRGGIARVVFFCIVASAVIANATLPLSHALAVRPQRRQTARAHKGRRTTTGGPNKQQERLATSHRGLGSALASGESGEGSSSSWEKEDRRRRLGMAVALGLANFSVMGAKCALPSVMSLLLSPDRGLTFGGTSVSPPRERFAGLLGCSTLAVALGKLLLGPLIDNMGGIRALQLALVLLTGLLATVSVAQTFGVFCVCWILVDFVFSSCWASCISSIQQSFPKGEWGSQIGHLATGARLGNAVSFSLFAAILFALEKSSPTQAVKSASIFVRQPWRVVFGVSTLMQIVPLGLLLRFGGKTLEQKRNDSNTSSAATGITRPVSPRLRDSVEILRREATTPEFWLHLVSRSCLMVFASFLLFVPTLMNDVYKCSNAVAAQVAAAYSLGCLLAVSFGSGLYSKLETARSRIASLVGLMGLATAASLVQLTHVSGLVPNGLHWKASTASMFVWGFAFSLPFYLPSSLYALARGGREGSASIADCFDVFGFGLLAWFNRFVASISARTDGDPSAWISCFVVTTLCALVAMLTQSLAVGLEAKAKTKEEAK